MSVKEMKVATIIVAGGTGTRAGLFPPKQYQKIGLQTVLEITVNQFVSHPHVDSCVVVISREHKELFDETVSPNIHNKLQLTFGGNSRTESVYNGLQHLKNQDISHVLIHDGARPFVSTKLITDMVSLLKSNEGIVPVVAISDAVWKYKDNHLVEPVSREHLGAAQTPQGFNYSQILQAYKKRAGHTADCAEIALAGNLKVAIVEGEKENYKITTAGDLEYARMMSKNDTQDFRVGQGVDVHKLVPGKSIVLCGVEIPFDKKLEGHSDADVGLHAITDAIYGSLGKGDIGTWFPPEDPAWKGTDSVHFLNHANRLLQEENYSITSIDCTFVCEEPKIKPHVMDMRKRVAKQLGINTDRVSIKATTSEMMGFTGRKEGILALATVSIAR